MAILNNSYLGMVRQWQEMFYDERYSEVFLSKNVPDYKMWAESMGCFALRVDDPDEVEAAVQQANEINDRPVVIDFRTDAGREGVPDGAVGCDQQRGHGAPLTGGRSGMSNENHQLHTLVVRVENKAGVLARIAGLFARRGFNIDSLAVAPVVDESFSRITIVVDVESAPLDQIVKQLDKLVNVLDIVELSPTESVERELMVITVRSDAIDELKQLTHEFSATWLDDREGQAMISISNFPARVEEFEERLKPFGIVELQRSGKIALHRLPD